MLRQIIKSLLGEKNTDRIRRIKTSINAAKTTYNTFSTTQSLRDRINLSLLLSVHMLEKAMATDNTKYLSSVKYSALIDSITRLLGMGLQPDDYTIAESIAVIRSALATLPGHDGEKSQLEALVSRHNITRNFRGGNEIIPSAEIFRHTDFDFHGFVSSRHSVRKFRDKTFPVKLYMTLLGTLFIARQPATVSPSGYISRRTAVKLRRSSRPYQTNLLRRDFMTA